MPLIKNELWIAGPGSGKSYKLVETALKFPDKKILLTTFTNSNTEVLKNLFYEQNNCIPPNVTIDSWWAILLKHGVKPFQGVMTDNEIQGTHLVNSTSSTIMKNGKVVGNIAEANTREYFFDNNYKIYTDKIALAVVRCNEKTNGLVMERLSLLFDFVMIDEAQDLVGYDLEIIRLLLLSESDIILAADPRQVTFQTHHSGKYKKYQQGKIKDFINDYFKNGEVQVDTKSLKDSRRCNDDICKLASQIYPEYPIIKSQFNTLSNHHNGIFYIHQNEVSTYLEDHNGVQLRNSIKTPTNPNFSVYNFGEAKGMTFDHVLIYPTKDIVDWIKSKDCEILAEETRAKFFVAVTRARYSVAFVLPDDKYVAEGQMGLGFK